MGLARRRAAARNALATIVAAILLPTLTLAADGQPQLLLPLVAAVAFGASAAHGADARREPSHGLSIVPPHMHIPDLYAVEVGRDPAPFAKQMDRDRLFSIDLLPHAHRGWMPSLVYDEEKP